MPQLTIQQAFDLALQHHLARRLPEAKQLYQQILDQQPGHSGAMHYLGLIAFQMGKIDLGIKMLRGSISLNPNMPEAHNNLGVALKEKGQADEAIVALQTAIALKFDYPGAHNNLGNVLKDKGRLDEAVAEFKKVIALTPNDAVAHNNLGNALKDQGRLDEAIAAHRRAIALDPNLPEAHSNLLFALYYHPASDAEAIAEEHRLWNGRHVKPLEQLRLPAGNDRDPERRIRLGYVSPDFRNHPVGRYLVPLLEHHNHHEFEVFCYGDVAKPDEITARTRASADQWRDITGYTDQRVAEQILADRIDLLIDTTAHTARNRMLVFARKPAPVQMTSLFTTGVNEIDFRLTDNYLDPPEEGDGVFVERPIRLPNCLWCFEPILAMPGVNPTPALKAGYVTFGSFNNFNKINPFVLKLWAEVLAAVPGSRMILQTPQGDHRRQIQEIFHAAGIVSERLTLLARGSIREYFERHHLVDICLDPTPYSGHTTSFDVLWMGVPLVTLAGSTAVGRTGVSILSNIGLSDLVARSPEEYVLIAKTLAADIPMLVNLRAQMRQRMLASPVMDAAGFARDVESAYRSMWRRSCNR